MNELDRKLTKVAVIGAGGKMGSGISLLLLQEMSWLELSKTGHLGSGVFQLHLIDQSEKALSGLFQYLKEQLRRHAEQKIQALRDLYRSHTSLVSNQEIIDAYVDGALTITRVGTEISNVKESSLIFEAVLEDLATKVALYKHIETINHSSPLYFTNTSSIPVQVMAQESSIEGRLLGFHFYNPPAVQKLLEIIAPPDVDEEVKKLAELLAKRLNKIVVHSRDIAGFIGNGQFIREILYTLEQVHHLAESAPLSKAIAFYDVVTRDLLLRPMGMFQLIDYVGLDVVQHIVKIMANFLPDPSFKVNLVDQLLQKGIKGGQRADGSQKDGFFSYAKGKPDRVYTLESGEYQPLPNLSQWMDPYPIGWKSWRHIQKDANLTESIKAYFKGLLESKTKGAEAAIEFLRHSKSISQKLVVDGVAADLDDVATVLKNGFFHLYGPEDIHV